MVDLNLASCWSSTPRPFQQFFMSLCPHSRFFLKFWSLQPILNLNSKRFLLFFGGSFYVFSCTFFSFFWAQGQNNAWWSSWSLLLQRYPLVLSTATDLKSSFSFVSGALTHLTRRSLPKSGSFERKGRLCSLTGFSSPRGSRTNPLSLAARGGGSASEHYLKDHPYFHPNFWLFSADAVLPRGCSPSFPRNDELPRWLRPILQEISRRQSAGLWGSWRAIFGLQWRWLVLSWRRRQLCRYGTYWSVWFWRARFPNHRFW